MWELVNRTKLLADRSFARDKDGSEVLIVVVKGTFDLEGSLIDAQAPIHRSPIHRGDPATSSLLYETDHCLRKSATDVLVHGMARAIRGEPTVAMEVGLRLGPLSKRLAIVGDRRWSTPTDPRGKAPPVLSDATAFVTMPIVWERAFGGQDGETSDSRNPCGTGYSASISTLAGKVAPNILAPGGLVLEPTDHPAPVGLGPIPRSWQPRLAFAGTHDAKWEQERMPLVPADYDPRFEQCAPTDQQVPGHLKGGETFELTGMSESGVIRGGLPARRLSLKTKMGGVWVPHTPKIHTVVLEPDERRVIVTWHSSVPCHTALYSLRKIVVTEERLDG